MDHIKKYVIPGIVVCLILIFAVYFIATRSANAPTSTLELSVTPSQNEANALTAVRNVTNTDTISGSRTGSVAAPKYDGLTAIRALPGTGTFVSLLERTGVASGISPVGTYTFFVPTDAAFAAAAFGPITTLSFADQKRIAQYHIIPNQKTSVDSVKFGHVYTLEGDLLNNNVFQDISVSGNSHILGTYTAPNGIIYLTDVVLLPPQPIPFPFR